MNKIKDIYKGEQIDIWKDEEFVTLSLGYTTIYIPKEIWEDVKKDIKKLAKLLK